METLPQGYLEFHRDALEVARRDVGLERPGEMADAVRILDAWVKQQNHFLKKDIHPVYLETLIIMSKGSLERAKTVLDKMCTVRTHQSQYFDLYDVRGEYEVIKETSIMLPLPQQTPEYYRVVVGKFSGTFENPNTMKAIYRLAYSSLDYMKRYGYSCGATLIYDVSACDLRDILANVNLMELKDCYVNLLESYGFRMKRIHLITASKLVYTLITFFKQFLKKKIVDRLIIHESYEELLQYYPKKILPKDYGGTERSLDELQEEFLCHLTSEEFRAYQKDMADMRVDESQRMTGDVISNGTFRALSID